MRLEVLDDRSERNEDQHTVETSVGDKEMQLKYWEQTNKHYQTTLFLGFQQKCFNGHWNNRPDRWFSRKGPSKIPKMRMGTPAAVF